MFNLEVSVVNILKVIAALFGSVGLLLGCGGTLGSVIMLLTHNDKTNIWEEGVPLLFVSLLFYTIGILCVVYVGNYKSKLIAVAFGFLLPIFLFTIFFCSSLFSDYFFPSTGKGIFLPSVITMVIALVSIRGFNSRYRKNI